MTTRVSLRDGQIAAYKSLDSTTAIIQKVADSLEEHLVAMASETLAAAVGEEAEVDLAIAYADNDDPHNDDPLLIDVSLPLGGSVCSDDPPTWRISLKDIVRDFIANRDLMDDDVVRLAAVRDALRELANELDTALAIKDEGA